MFRFIGSNKIAEIPAEVLSGLGHLKELQLYKNKISTVPPEIGNLTGILLYYEVE